MAREKGIVLEIHGNRCVVLTREGEFRTVSRPAAAAVGREIELGRPAALGSVRFFLAAASLFVVLVAGTLFTSLFPAAGYVSVDINPSIELGMNAWGRVVRAQGLNADGQTLLKSLPLYGSPLDQALDSIANEAVAMHYLKADDPDNMMVVTYTPGRLALARLRRQEEAYQALADQLKAEHVPAGLLFAEMTPAQRHQARAMGLSAGKYLVRERLLGKGLNIPAQQMAKTSIAKLLQAEKLQLDAVMGPNTTYREVRPEGTASAGGNGQGKAVHPGSTAVSRPATPSRQQDRTSQGTAGQPWRWRTFLQRLREKLGAADSGQSGGSSTSGDSTVSGRSKAKPADAGQPTQKKMAPSGAGTESRDKH